jgi:hypothetical protein
MFIRLHPCCSISNNPYEVAGDVSRFLSADLAAGEPFYRTAPSRCRFLVVLRPNSGPLPWTLHLRTLMRFTSGFGPTGRMERSKVQLSL